MSTALNATKDDQEGESAEYDIVEVTAETESEAPVKEDTKNVGLYSWFVLGVLLAIRIVYQW